MRENPAFGRIKRAVRAALALCGGIDGGAATVDKSRSLVGSWNNLNEEALPTLGDALALDEIAVAGGHRPEILHRMAAELGHVAIRLPNGSGGADAETGALAEATAEFGDVARALMAGRADGDLSLANREEVGREIDEAQAALARMKAVVLPPGVTRGQAGLASVPVRQVKH